MSINITFNGQTFPIPTDKEVGWAQNMNNYLTAIAAGALQKSGGAFTLAADVDFGASYGLIASSYKSKATNPSTTGTVRLGNTEKVAWRDAGNANDIYLAVDSSGKFSFNGSAVSATELGYLAGATSAIQTQINAKAPTAAPTFTGTVTLPNATFGASSTTTSVDILPTTDYGASLGSASYHFANIMGASLSAKYSASVSGSGRMGFTNSSSEGGYCGFVLTQFQIASNNSDGVCFFGNTSLGTSPSYGGGSLVLFLQNRSAAPSSNPTGGGILYAENGALKWRGSSGTVTTIAAA